MTEVKQKTDEAKARQRKRSLALGIALGVVVVLFYALTIVKMGPGIMNRPL